MKLRNFIGSVTILMLGLSGAAYANSYYPPERINCTLNEDNNLSCKPFNRQYLTEDTTNADLQKGKDETFYFVSAVVYFTPNKEEASIFFTYNNHQFKMVKLKTVNTSIRPDLINGQWKKFNEEIYNCDAGYMNCPITNLPAFLS